MEHRNIDIALRVSEILSCTDHEVHMVVRSPKDKKCISKEIPDKILVVPVTDSTAYIHGRYDTVKVSDIYSIFKTINTGVSPVEGSPDQLTMYYSTSSSGTVIGNHEYGYILSREELNDFKNHCKMKLSPNGYIFILTVDDVSNESEVVSAIEDIMEFA